MGREFTGPHAYRVTYYEHTEDCTKCGKGRRLEKYREE
jgi:hypothetical protein